MVATTQKMYNAITEKINQLNLDKNINLQQLQQVIGFAAFLLEELKTKVRQHRFADEAEEIHFYKELKPRLYALYIYHASIYQIETSKPVGTKKWKRKYLQNELKKLDDFFFQNLDFYKYYRSGDSHYDKQYFTRGQGLTGISIDLFSPIIDQEFCTLYSLKVATVIANEGVKEYVEKELLKLRDLKALPKEPVESEVPNKFQVMLSVDQLAIFLRAAVDSKIIANAAYNWVAGKLAPYLATKNTMSIATRSLRNKGSVPTMESKDLEVTKDAVMAIYKMICKY